jgi:hypothetical protein
MKKDDEKKIIEKEPPFEIDVMKYKQFIDDVVNLFFKQKLEN